MNQRFDGREVFGAYATVNVADGGRVVFVGDSLVRGLRSSPSGAADLGPAGAVRAAAEALELDPPKALKTLSRGTGAAQRTVLSGSGVSDSAIPARLGWQPTGDGLRLAWQLVIDDASASHLWNATVDAANGDLLDVQDWTSHDSAKGLAARLGRTPATTKAGAKPPALTSPDPVNDGSSYRVFELPRRARTTARGRW